ncbi:hypothetical protein MXB_3854 [Myxobolus squamalis]|nr:hypothetical protein MXB_3854 [Myxobolus squamalis]
MTIPEYLCFRKFKSIEFYGRVCAGIEGPCMDGDTLLELEIRRLHSIHMQNMAIFLLALGSFPYVASGIIHDALPLNCSHAARLMILDHVERRIEPIPSFNMEAVKEKQFEDLREALQ